MVDTAPDETRPATTDKLILASRVEETPVFNQAGERIGHIADLSIDRMSGRVTFAIMSFGGFLGIGRRFHPLPWSMLHYDVERDGYVVPVERQALVDAPHYDADELRALGGHSHDYQREIMGYYGIIRVPLI